MSRIPSPSIGINGFGRMGFCALRICIENDLPITAINASRTPSELSYLFRFDSVHGRFDGDVRVEADALIINGRKICVTHERDPAKIPWKDFGVEYVIDCTGKFLTQETASAHILGGAKKVIMSAPSKDGDATPMFVMGVNENTYTPDMNIVSNASCTTNCLAPLAKIIDENFGIESGLMTTIHAETSKQNTVDGYGAKDPRIARSGLNIIPSTTGAAKAVGRVIPNLKGKLTGMSMRVPVTDGSVVDLTVNLYKRTTYEDICKVMKEASEDGMSGIISFWDEPVVSSDFIHDSCTCNFDATAGIMLSPTFVKLIAWYDNEWAYMSQLIDLIMYMNIVDHS